MNPSLLERNVELTLDVFNIVGIIVFAISGALAASRRQMDPFGFAALATVTGIGGGTLRDLLLGVRPVNWIETPEIVVICAVVGVAVYFGAHFLEPYATSPSGALVWADAIGLAVFAVVGTERALALNAPAISAVTMGMITAVGGGVIRDLLSNEPPLILHREIYALAALVGGASTWFLESVGVVHVLAVALSCFLAFLTRAVGIIFGWSLPSYRHPLGNSSGLPK